MTTIAQPTLERPPRQRGVVGPLFLIALGVILLMNTLGLWGWEVWGRLLMLWPLLLVAGGLDILVGRRSAGARLLVLVLTILMFAAGYWYVSSDLAPGARFEERAISQAAGAAERAEITLAGGVGTLRVSAAPSGDRLVAGEIELARNERANEQFDMRGDTARYRLVSESEGRVSVFPWLGGEKLWAIQLSPDLPMTLDVSTGVGEADLDLAALTISELRLNTGVGETTLTLPREGRYDASIEAGVGEVTIRLPEGLAARISVESGLGPVDVRGDFERSGDDYLSPGWSDAVNRVTLRVNAGVGAVTIEGTR